MSQNVAPGPPVEMATATPAMLPMPTVPETAVVNALNCEISPGSPARAYLPETMRSASANPRTLMNRRWIVKNNPPATSHSTISGISVPNSGTVKKTKPDTASATGRMMASMR